MNCWILGVVVGVIVVAIIALLLFFLLRKKCPVCAEGEKCYDYACVPADKCTPACKEGETCINGVCETINQLTPCSVDSQCEIGFHCSKGYCVNTCINEASCPGSQVCIKGLCKLRMCREGIECADNEGCLPLDNHSYCVGAISCTSEYPCPEGLICEGGVCKQCITGGDCPTSICEKGRCATCLSPNDVPLAECAVAGTCSLSGTCCPLEGLKKRCKSEADCPTANPHCLKAVPEQTGFCTCTKIKDGLPCTNNSQCISGKCKEVCYSQECFNSIQCKAGEYCKNQLCSKDILDSYCTLSSTDACRREGNYCVNNICQKTPGTYGSSCLADKDCAEGYACKPSVKEKYFPLCLPK